MKRVKVTHKDGRKWQGEFADPTQWKDEQVGLNSWGLPERTILSSEPHDVADVLETIPEVTELVPEKKIVHPQHYKMVDGYLVYIPETIETIPEHTNIVSPAKVKLKPEYTLIEEDMTAEIAAKNAVVASKDTAKTATQKAKQALAAAKSATTLAETQAALIKVSRSLFNLVKYLEITDPTEAE
jgi:hypothetical protein